MQLDEAKRVFEQNGETIYKMITFSLGNVHNGGQVSLPHVHWMFQKFFVTLLKTPISERELENAQRLPWFPITDAGKKDPCRIAEAHFHDLVCCETYSSVPGDIKSHLTSCRNCAGRFIQFLRFFGADLNRQHRSYVKRTATELFRHFSLLGVQVGCRQARRFLPLLADPEPEIAIFTPVTVHLDHCRRCRADFESLDSLQLSSQQLTRLAEFYGRAASGASAECADFADSAALIARMRFDQVSPDALEHICSCKNCRQLLYNERAATTYSVDDSEPADYPCDSVDPGDLFDYCLLFAPDPADDWRAQARTAFSTHISHCPACLEKMRQLHDTLYGIADRGESGIVTSYELESRPKETEFADVSDLYADGEISVWVRDESRDAQQVIAMPERIEQGASGRNLRRFRMPAAAASILIAVAFWMLLISPAAGRIALAQVYQAIANLQNICISSFAPPEVEPVQEVWVSLALDVRLHITPNQAVLFDLQRKIKKTKDLSTGSVETTSITPDLLVEVERHVAGSFGLVPFPDIADVPGDAQWTHVPGDQVETVIPGTDVYDLTWRGRGGELTRHHKWRVFVDADTALPKRTEWSVSLGESEDSGWEDVYVVTYPSSSEIETLVRSIFD
ncbi:MAG: hypothetical protein ACYTEX_10575 [Planctomycetota bacterium]